MKKKEILKKVYRRKEVVDLLKIVSIINEKHQSQISFCVKMTMNGQAGIGERCEFVLEFSVGLKTRQKDLPFLK